MDKTKRSRSCEVELKNINKNLLLIDASRGIDSNYIDEILINPSSVLMLTENIKQGLNEYVESAYLSKVLILNIKN